MTGVELGTVPPGFTTPAERWKHMIGGDVAAMMRRIDFDGTQKCDGDDRYTSEGDWEYDDETAADMYATCHGCPFLTPCRDWAVAHERWNYYAGTTPMERNRYRRLHRIQVVDRYASSLYGLTTEKREYA
jgi:hypothetical protein